MDKTMINLMFAYKGSINSREFRVGLCILFVSAMAMFGLMSSYMLYYEILSKLDVENVFIRNFSNFQNLVNTFIPTLIPLGFMLSYSAFVLALKRMRALNAPCGWGILSGVVNYFFFASVPALLRYASFWWDNRVPMYDEGFQNFGWFLYVLLFLLILGIVNLVILSIRRDESLPEINLFGQVLNAPTYALQTGNLMAVSAIAMGVLTGILVLIAQFVSQEAVGIFSILFLLLAIFIAVYNFILMIRRMRDTAYSPAWIAWVFLGYLIVVGLIVLLVHLWTPLVMVAFAVVQQFLIAFQFMLFALPSKNSESLP